MAHRRALSFALCLLRLVIGVQRRSQRHVVSVPLLESWISCLVNDLRELWFVHIMKVLPPLGSLYCLLRAVPGWRGVLAVELAVVIEAGLPGVFAALDWTLEMFCAPIQRP